MNQGNQPNNHQQYQQYQQPYQHPINTNQNGQPNPSQAQSWVQQPNIQQAYQVPTQQVVSTQQQPGQATRPQQQWPQQYYQQGSFPQQLTANNPYPQAQLALATPSAQWQTNTNTTTTTTQTTTTQQSSKQTRPQEQQQNVTSMVTDFSRLMQQPPQQQQSQAQIINHASYASQSTPLPPPAQTQTQQTTNFTHLMQTAPPQPQTQSPLALPLPPTTSARRENSYSQSNYRVISPTKSPALPHAAAQKSVNQDSRGTYTASKSASTSLPSRQLPALQPVNQGSSNTTTTNTTTTTNAVGSTSRQEAANKGERELKRFDQHVTATMLLLCEDMGECPMQWDWYAAREGYLCGGGQHFVSHEDVEVMLKTGREPRIEHVNTYGHPTLRQVTPPPGGGNGSGEEPAFWSTEFRRSVGMPPLNSTIEIREGGGRSAGFGGVGLGGMYGLGGAYEAMYGRMGSGFRRRRGFP